MAEHTLQKFSIIIPLYNRVNIIQETLDTVLQQNYRPVEIVVVDDGSSDGSAEMVREWAEAAGCGAIGGQRSEVGAAEPLKTEVGSRKSEIGNPTAEDCAHTKPNHSSIINDQRKSSWEVGDDQLVVRYFYQNNAGVAAARNRGIKELSGAYVYFLDSDDRLYPQALDTVAGVFSEQGADLILTGYDIFDTESGEVLETVPGYADDQQIEHVVHGEVNVVTLRTFFTRTLVGKTGDWNTAMKMSEDTEFIQRALCLADRPFGLKEVVAGLRRGGIDHRSFDFDQTCRVHCNELFLSNLIARTDVPMHLKQEMVIKVAKLGCKLRMMGNPELARRCAKAAKSAAVPRSKPMSVRLMLCDSGWIGAALFMGLYKLRGRLG